MMNSVLENFTILLVTVLSLSCFGRLSPEAGEESQEGVGAGRQLQRVLGRVLGVSQPLNSHIHQAHLALVRAQEGSRLAVVSKPDRTRIQKRRWSWVLNSGYT